MITRIIKLTSKVSADEFMAYMNEIIPELNAMDGCSQVEVLRGKINENIFFIYTIWKNSKALNKFRDSQFNQVFWNKLNEMSESRPQVWSVENIFEK